MKVKELIETLKKCDQEADVCVECCKDSYAFTVAQYEEDGKVMSVYIGDDLWLLDETLVGEYHYTKNIIK